MSFAVLADPNDTSSRTGEQIHITEISKGDTTQVNKFFIKELGKDTPLQRNPDIRFEIEIFDLSSEGAHYLKSEIYIDSCGVVVRISRFWTSENFDASTKYRTKGIQENPRLLYLNDPFELSLFEKQPDYFLWKDDLVKPSPKDLAQAELELMRFQKIAGGSLLELQPDDIQNMKGAGKDYQKLVDVNPKGFGRNPGR